MHRGGAIFIRHGLLIVPVVVLVVLAMAGNLGEGYGFPNLFIDHPGEYPALLPNSTDNDALLRFWMTSGTQVAFSATILFGLIWVLALLITSNEEEPGNTHPIYRASRAVWPAVFILSLFAILGQQLGTYRSLQEAYYSRPKMLAYHMTELVLSLLGALAGLIFVYVSVRVTLWIARRWRIPQADVALAVGAVLTGLFTLSPALMPGFAFFNVLGLFVVLYLAYAAFGPKTRLIVTLAAITWSVFCGSVSLKHNFTDLKRFYELPKTSWPKLAAFEGCTLNRKTRKAAANHLATSLDYLDRWHKVATKNLAPGEKPVFVVVAASGGAYRATYWTSLALDKLMNEVTAPRRFKDSVGLLVGASGGMVASSYFAAMSAQGEFEGAPESLELTKALDHDIRDFPREKFADKIRGLLSNARRDSLTPVVQRQLQYDIPHSWWPARLEMDRGEILQNLWRRISDVKFHDLLSEDDTKPFSPAIIFSPMLVDSGRPLLISNLNLSCIATQETHAVELFRLFPDAQKDVSLATAARMSAAFPYITPASEIPVEPVQRVVDAGYYDNDGVTAATAFLQSDEVKTWLIENVARVVVIRLNAFRRVSEVPPQCSLPPPPEQPVSAATHFSDSLFRSASWLTGPIEGAWVARDTRARFSNRQTIDGLKATFQGICHDDSCKSDFLQEVELAFDGDASESWHLPTRELCNMQLALGGPAAISVLPECEDYAARKAAAEAASGQKIHDSCANIQSIEWIKHLLEQH